MNKNNEPVILSKSKISSTYVTLDTIHTPLTLSNNRNEQIYVDTYRVADVNIDVCNLKHDYATEQFIYRITGVCCNVYDNILVRACICLTKHVCCDAWTKRKQNFIILPDSRLLPANVYWITVFELVYKLKYPQSNNSNKCFVYALNCMLKSGMLTLDDCIDAKQSQYAQHCLLYMYSLPEISRCLRGNRMVLPKSVYRYYKIFGKRLNRKYKKDQMPGGHVFHLPKVDEDVIAEEYANAVCKCIKLNPPIEAKDVAKYNTKRKKPKAQFADIRKMSDNVSTIYTCMYLYLCGEPAKACNVYSNPWVFVKYGMLRGQNGVTKLYTSRIYLKSEYFTEKTVVENTVSLLFVLYHEYAHVYHWRAKSRHNTTLGYDAHCANKCGTTYEHHAHKFALWCLLVDKVSIELISSTLSSLHGDLNEWERLNYSHRAILRYCRWLAYLNNKYGKLHIPVDLGYIFFNHEKGRLYKPNEEIVIK